MRIPNELDALDAVRDLVDLPPTVAALYGRRDDLAKPTPPLAAVTPVASRIANGETPAKAVKAHADEQAAANAAAQLAEDTRQARTAIRHRLAREIATHRDGIIAGSLTPAVAALLDDVRQHADTLGPFLPTLDEAALLRDGTDAQLSAWRATREPTEQLGRLVAAFAALWRRAASGPPLPTSPPRFLNIDAPGGIHTWAAPRALDDVPDVRDGRQLDAVAIAAYADRGRFRLATIAELIALERHTRLVRPLVPGERSRRNVHLPDGELVAPRRSAMRGA